MAEKRQIPTPVYVKPVTPAVHLDREVNNQMARAHGVDFEHWRAMRCPVGLVDTGDHRQPHADHENCSYGYVYTKAGVVKAVFTGNSSQRRDANVGMIDPATAQLTFALYYEGMDSDDPEAAVTVQPQDRLYLIDPAITVARYETTACSITGRERVGFPIVRVQDCIDERGGRHKQGSDFDIGDGKIVWRAGKGPVNPGNGSIIAVRYLYRPFFYVFELTHELRLTKVADHLGTRTAVQPQAAMVRREYTMIGSGTSDAQNDRAAPPAPSGGGFYDGIG